MRKYRVLSINPVADSAEREQFTDLGEHEAHDADAAIEAGLEAHGLDEGVARAVAIPSTNWSERAVEKEPRPRFKVRPIAEPQT